MKIPPVRRDDRPTENRILRKKSDAREKIVKTAIGLFKRHGYASTTMDQIAKTADVARKTLYNYFPVKEAIADAYVRATSNRIAEESLVAVSSLPDTKSRLIAALSNAYTWVEANPEITAVVIGHRFKMSFWESDKPQEETGTQRIVAEIIRMGQENGEIRSDITAQIVVRYVDMLRGSMLSEWLKAPTKYDMQREIPGIVDVILFGIGAVIAKDRKKIKTVKNKKRL